MTLHKYFKLLKYCVVSALVLLTTNSVVGNFYFQGGGSFWPDFSVQQITSSGIPLDRPQQSSVVRNIDVWISAGYALNDNWNIEAFFARLPETNAFSPINVYYQGVRIDAATGTINLATETAMVGVGGGYEFPISERIWLTGKVGFAFAQNESDLDLFLPNFQVPIAPEDIDDFDVSDITQDIDVFHFDEESESTVDTFFAVGIRVPIDHTNTSVTATYQLVKTAKNTESGLFLGLRWDI
ncbi:MAG: porin family protein [Gammaproteobacteria bacterium]|nr:porin family protein [Gammaproteobacteria bacterium]MYC26023.1 porin family protein [Gammaproteobacteria bacterium]